MGSIISEFLKLKRSLSWVVVILLPMIMVVAGSASTVAVEGEFTAGWHTLWVRSIGFWGMAILPVGIAILASLVWRVEHKNSNWNALMSGPMPTWQIVIGKIAAIAILAAAMHVVLLISVIALGKVFGLPGMLPADYFISSILVIIAQIPVAALQSALSTFFRSFAAPVAIGLVLAGACTMALLLKIQVTSLIMPYALLTQTTQIGTEQGMLEGGTSFDITALTPTSVLLTLVTSAVLAVVIIAANSMILNRSDTRA